MVYFYINVCIRVFAYIYIYIYVYMNTKIYHKSIYIYIYIYISIYICCLKGKYSCRRFSSSVILIFNSCSLKIDLGSYTMLNSFFLSLSLSLSLFLSLSLYIYTSVHRFFNAPMFIERLKTNSLNTCQQPFVSSPDLFSSKICFFFHKY